jgi:hypothetical protein
MWNYRVVRKKSIYIDRTNKKERVDYTYAIHEAYYDENGHVEAITQEPVEPFGENVEELRHSYDRKKDPIGFELDERLKEIEAGNKKGIPSEHVKRELEKKWGPFDEEEYRKQVDEERLEKERIHNEAFIGTPTLKELIKKMYSDYQEYIQRDRAENPCKYSAKDA